MEVKDLFEELGHSMNDVKPLSGGDINQVVKVGERVFKINHASDFPQMFAREAEGLKLLSQHIKTPWVFAEGVSEDLQYLGLEFIPEGDKNPDFWESFGRGLARVHEFSDSHFGLDENNYIGSLVQKNGRHDKWSEFLTIERLQPMIEMAVNGGDVNYVESKIIEKFYARIEEIYPDEPPALVHGDLWSGNFICAQGGVPVLIDPAVYFGHREMDLGMMHLFGGFDLSLFDVYNETFPLEDHWRDRIEINQLYPLLVHVNLFGRSYWPKVVRILKPFS